MYWPDMLSADRCHEYVDPYNTSFIFFFFFCSSSLYLALFFPAPTSCIYLEHKKNISIRPFSTKYIYFVKDTEISNHARQTMLPRVNPDFFTAIALVHKKP